MLILAILAATPWLKLDDNLCADNVGAASASRFAVAAVAAAAAAAAIVLSMPGQAAA